MRDPKQAEALLAIAERDHRALCGMEDPAVFSDEIFGFHVQQAVEKTLKAWLCCLGVPFPRTHDLDELGALLEEAGQTTPEAVAGLLEFTDFAVVFRYEAFGDMEADIDRRDAVDKIARLLQHVRKVIA
ncbi:HEPN domain-containing protein [Anaerobaca lacustris]|uniref:HEPN domain-containing protein n=1 Tax=Anaerobaca lacustris TaxID=3044600 RepID=A0AAW6U1Z6_9BACT|nr:HEPN domain-containing protein [Sedimentisphaerales bacterium M17dextr]